ncbi:MAG: hypothetical protein WCR30_03000 [Clostridia bacterium]
MNNISSNNDQKFIIAVSKKDFSRHGCVNCNCEKVKKLSNDNGVKAVLVECYECGTKFVVLEDGFDCSVDKGFDAYGTLKFNNAILKNELAYPFKEDHPNRNPKHSYVKADLKPEYGEYFYFNAIRCNHLSAYVQSKEAGLRIIKMFEEQTQKKAEKDKFCFVSGTKPAVMVLSNENPNLIELKIGYSEKYKVNIEILRNLTEKTKIITPEIISQAQNFMINLNKSILGFVIER